MRPGMILIVAVHDNYTYSCAHGNQCCSQEPGNETRDEGQKDRPRGIIIMTEEADSSSLAASVVEENDTDRSSAIDSEIVEAVHLCTT